VYQGPGLGLGSSPGVLQQPLQEGAEDWEHSAAVVGMGQGGEHM